MKNQATMTKAEVEAQYRAKLDAKESERFGSRFEQGGFTLPLPSEMFMRSQLRATVPANRDGLVSVGAVCL